MISERWIVAIEGELGSDGRGLAIGQTIWLDKVPVVRFENSIDHKVIGYLTDFHVKSEAPREITALYEGEPIQGTLSPEGITIDSVGGMRSRWLVFEIRGAADLETPVMFADWARRVN